MKNKKIYIGLCLLFIMLIASMYLKDFNNRSIDTDYFNISGSDAVKMVKDNVVTIVDVRTTAEYMTYHIKGAASVPLDKIDSKATDWLKEKNANYIVYCESGSRSKLAAKKLADMGYKKIYDLGSMNNWPLAISK